MLKARIAQADGDTAARLADLFWLQLDEGPVSEGMLGLSCVTPTLLKRFVVSRLRSTLSADYRAHKFGHHLDVSPWQRLERLTRELLALARRPGRWATYRAMALENRRLIAGHRQGVTLGAPHRSD